MSRDFKRIMDRLPVNRLLTWARRGKTEPSALYRLPIGSNPLFVIARAASGDARNLITEYARAESVVLAATPAENTETF